MNLRFVILTTAITDPLARMTNHSSFGKSISTKSIVLSAGLAFAAFTPFAPATDLYWDVNQGADNTGNTAAGAWDGVAFNWNTDSTGGAGGATQAITTNADPLHFSSGTNFTGAFNVTVSGAQVARSLLFEEGTVTVTGGTSIDMTGGTGIVDVATGITGIINTLITGSSGITKTGAGTLGLGSGNATINTFTGGVFIDAGTLLAGSNGGGLLTALGANNVTLGASSGGADAKFQVTRNQTYLTTSQTFTVNAGTTGTLRIAAGPTVSLSQTPTIAAPITLNNALTIGNGISGVGVGGITLGGQITGSSAITIDGGNAATLSSTGAGTIASLTGPNSATLTSTINVSRGTLRLNAAGAGGTGTINVNGGGTVAAAIVGNSSTGALGNVVVTNGNIVAPGSHAVNATGNSLNGTQGTLGLGTGVGSSLTLTNANLFFDLAVTAITGNDRINTDTLSLGSTVAFTFNGLGGALETGVEYTLINSVNAPAGFDTANFPSTFLGTLAGQYAATYSINGSNDLVATFAVVPEPGTFATLLGGVGLLGLLRRRP